MLAFAPSDSHKDGVKGNERLSKLKVLERLGAERRRRLGVLEHDHTYSGRWEACWRGVASLLRSAACCARQAPIQARNGRFDPSCDSEAFRHSRVTGRHSLTGHGTPLAKAEKAPDSPNTAPTRPSRPSVGLIIRQTAMHRATQRRLEQERQRQQWVGNLRASVLEHEIGKHRGDWEAQAGARAAAAAAARAEAEEAALRQREEAARRAAEREAVRRAEAEAQAAAAAAVVTPAQRRAQMAAQARELAARREAERAALAEGKLAQQFARSCDLLRTRQSQQRAAQAASAWAAQQGERRAACEVQRQADSHHQREFEAYVGRLEERHQQVGAGQWGGVGQHPSKKTFPAGSASCV